MLLINHYFADFVHKESIAVSKNGRKERDGEMEQYVDYKGSHPPRKVQFFLTLFKRPLTPPPLFEHLSYFAGGVF